LGRIVPLGECILVAGRLTVPSLSCRRQLVLRAKEVSLFAANNAVAGLFPYTAGPQQLYGIELNVYAHELASVVVWIGYIQWLHDNGFGIPEDPILMPLHNIRHMDALLARAEEGRTCEPVWPEADSVIGNPPFLGGKRLRSELGDTYVDALFALYRRRVPHEADLVCYSFERARALIGPNVAKVGISAKWGDLTRVAP